MTEKQPKIKLTGSERISLLIAAIFFCGYVLNVLLGKVNIVYGTHIFHLGNVGEFLILFTASIAFVVAALHQETVFKSNTSSNQLKSEEKT